MLHPAGSGANGGPAPTASNDSPEQPVKLQRGVDTGWHYSFCGGTVTLGPDWKSFMLSVLILVAPSVVFMVLVAPWLGKHLSWAIVVISILLIVATISLLFITALTNPGYLPRSEELYSEDVEWGRQHPAKEFEVNGYTVVTKWCTTCEHYRPPRCSHCAVCDNCVDKFDHHCPWVGTCVGRRNYRFFLSFIFMATLLCTWVFAFSLVQLLKYSDESGVSFGRAIAKYPASMVCLIYTFLAFWFVGGLSAFHLYLSSSNQTTYEHFRHRYSGAGNPYNQGPATNYSEIFCTRIPPMTAIAKLGSKVPKVGEEGRPRFTDTAHLANGAPPNGPRMQNPAYSPYQSFPLVGNMDPNAMGPPLGARFPNDSSSITLIAVHPHPVEVELQQQQQQLRLPRAGPNGLSPKRNVSESGSMTGSPARSKTTSIPGDAPSAEHHVIDLPDVGDEGGAEGDDVSVTPSSRRERTSVPGSVSPSLRSSGSRAQSGRKTDGVNPSDRSSHPPQASPRRHDPRP